MYGSRPKDDLPSDAPPAAMPFPWPWKGTTPEVIVPLLIIFEVMAVIGAFRLLFRGEADVLSVALGSLLLVITATAATHFTHLIYPK